MQNLALTRIQIYLNVPFSADVCVSSKLQAGVEFDITTQYTPSSG